MRKFLGIMMTTVMVLGILCTMPFVKSSAAIPGIAFRNQSEIINYLRSSGAGVNDVMNYSSQPFWTEPYSAGVLSQASLNSAVKMLNQIRYIAGLNSNVTLDATYNTQCQAAALVMAANGALSHNPARPAGMPDSLYNSGRAGAANSNISNGFSNLNSAILHGWMADNDMDNIVHVGHRRWILNPSTEKVGFGWANRYGVMYCRDSSRNGAERNVVWPAQNTPASYFRANYPWSLSVGENLAGRSITVTLVRKSNGQRWNFSTVEGFGEGASGYFNINNDGFGQRGCVIFRPNGAVVAPGESYDVSITGTPEPITYTVNFFDANPAPATTAPSTTNPPTTRPGVSNTIAAASIALDRTSATLGVGQKLRLTPTVSPNNATNKTVTFSSNNTAVASVNSSTGQITARKAGTAVITARTSNGRTKTCAITVKSAPTKITMKNKVTLGVGQKHTPKLEYAPKDAHTGRSYKSSDTKVAKVNKSTGKITAVKPGKATITVTTYNGMKDTIVVTVKPEPTKVTMKNKVTLGVGEKYTLPVTVTPKNAHNKRSYKSSDKSIVKVNKNTGRITAVKPGKATITVTTYNGKKDTIVVTVRKAPGSVKLDKSRVTVKRGDTATLKASVPSGTASRKRTWTTSDKKVATVKNGKIKAVGRGTCVITVKTFNGKTKTCIVTVK